MVVSEQLGDAVGINEGECVTLPVGMRLGATGIAVGLYVGMNVGSSVGVHVGIEVGG